MTRLELFYDLVFVFAFLNVSSLASVNLTRSALLEALLVLALLWWLWGGFVALSNIVRADQGIMPLVGFAIMAALFVLALATDTAFRDEPGGLDGPFVFALAYATTEAIVLVALYATIETKNPASRRRSVLLSLPTILGALIVLLGGTAPQLLFPADIAHNLRLGSWAAALVVAYSGGLVIGRVGWRLKSVEHFAERHALIVLIALGESVISLGVGATSRNGRPITATVVLAAVLGIAVIAALWWLYFDLLAFHVEQVLHRARGQSRIVLGRDIYTYLHLPLVSGVIIFSLGLQRLLSAVIQKSTIDGWNLISLFGGVILYLVALVAVELRSSRRLDPVSLAGAALLVLLLPVADRLPAIAALIVLTATIVAVVVAQLLTKRGVRKQVRHRIHQEQIDLEAAVVRWRHRHQ
ncbi:low temperature requirement protein A [Phytohabitans flavus]|uniref:Low temperature requirement protein A n=1 Tax=Phytohabitans flavus TaxID=1076124 RepID=A0A6F8Y789_9ACTN|nr:low temperature requirement protein A [Phytohabitans flavus]BCB81927.1 low temperature requirement protein A [Phytohabitans flavus]